jgi:hypothetical protein
MPRTLLKLVFESILIILSSSAIIAFGKNYKEFKTVCSSFSRVVSVSYAVPLPGLPSHASSHDLHLVGLCVVLP